MMKGILFAVTLFVLGLAWATQASAQEEHYSNRPYELNINGGAHFVDLSDEFGVERDTDVGFGGRIVMNRPSGWGFGGNFTWILSNVDIDDDPDNENDIDVSTYLYSAEVDYTFPSSSQGHFFVGAGVGAATIKLSDAPEGSEDSETDLLIPLAAGYKWFNRTNSPSWAIRGDVRDNITWSEVFSEDLTTENKPIHNLELSAGVSFLFGGGM